MKQYVYHIVQNDVDADQDEFDDHGYYRVEAQSETHAEDQLKQNVPNVVFWELLKINV